MKNIKRLISLLLLLVSVWIIWYVPFYIVAEYPGAAAQLTSLIIVFSLVLGLSTFTSKNRTLDNIRILIIVLSMMGLIPGIYFSYKYIIRAKYSFLLREGIMGRAVVTDKKISSSPGKNPGIVFTHYELYFSFVTNEKRFSRLMDQVSEKKFESVNVRDSINVVYLPERTDIADLIISQNDSAFYAAKLRPIR